VNILQDRVGNAMPISAADIQTEMAKRDDFGYELRVGAVIRKLWLQFSDSFHIEQKTELSHGGTYDDSVTDKPRQFDWRCSLTKGGGERREQLALAVECKNLDPESPLVVSAVPRVEGESFHDVVVSKGPGHIDERIGKPLPERSFKLQRVPSFYRAHDLVGKKAVRIKRDDKGGIRGDSDSDVYDKWAQAIASSVGLVEEASQCAPPACRVYSAVLPVVVVPDGSLWVVQHDKDGKANLPTQMDNCEYFVGRRISLTEPPNEQFFRFSHFHFFTVKGFEKFLSETANEKRASVWNKLFPSSLLL
jgi:hypothetical protein